MQIWTMPNNVILTKSVINSLMQEQKIEEHWATSKGLKLSVFVSPLVEIRENQKQVQSVRVCICASENVCFCMFCPIQQSDC